MYYKTSDTQLFDLYESKILTKEKPFVIKEGSSNSSDNNESNVSMDKAFFEEFDLRLVQARVKLMNEFPYYGIMLSKLKVCPTYDLDTMAVDQHGNIYINPKFTMSMTLGETMGVLAHEVSHILTHSFPRQQGRTNFEAWNIATDFMMNLDLIDMGVPLPKQGCIPEKEGDKFFAVFPGTDFKLDITEITAEDLYEQIIKELEKQKKDKNENGKGESTLNKPYKVGDRVRSKITGQDGTITAVSGTTVGQQTLSVEWDNDELKTEALQTGVKSKDVMPLLSGDVTLKPGDGNAKEGEDFALDKNAKVTIEKSPPKNAKPGTNKTKEKSLADVIDEIIKKRDAFDKHLTTSPENHPKIAKTPTNDPDYEPDFHDNPETEMKSKVQSSIAEASKRGTGGGAPRSFRMGTKITTTPWKRLIRDFLSGLEKTRTTYQRLDKRSFSRGYPMPRSVNEQNKIKTILAIDTSGSISEEILSRFLSEILTILSQFRSVEMKLILWHSQVYEDINLDSGKSSVSTIMDALQNLSYQGGGTELSSVKRYLEQKYSQNDISKYAGCIVFTDGFVESNPEMPKVQKKIFLITKDGSTKQVEHLGPVYKIDPYQN